MKKALDALNSAGYFILAGALVMIGFRAVEWAIPRPDQHVLLCMAKSTYVFGECKTLASVLEAANVKEK